MMMEQYIKRAQFRHRRSVSSMELLKSITASSIEFPPQSKEWTTKLLSTVQGFENIKFDSETGMWNYDDSWAMSVDKFLEHIKSERFRKRGFRITFAVLENEAFVQVLQTIIDNRLATVIRTSIVQCMRKVFLSGHSFVQCDIYDKHSCPACSNLNEISVYSSEYYSVPNAQCLRIDDDLRERYVSITSQWLWEKKHRLLMNHSEKMTSVQRRKRRKPERKTQSDKWLTKMRNVHIFTGDEYKMELLNLFDSN
eukprot:GHVH01007950.1.p1 GENE.GHVH01007950.1~~GHVH01007950.1.p1  ORF type:complete len:253 (-),score=30.60 GHVH01007950.1:75-833(-)